MIMIRTERSELARWIFCATIVASAHVAVVALALAQWREPAEEGDRGTEAILVDLTPMPMTADTHNDLPPGPEQIQADATPERPIERTEARPDALAEQTSEVMLPHQPEQQPPPVPQEESPPAPATTAPQIARSRTSIPSWKGEIVDSLERNKRYPPEARTRGEQGVAQLAFSIDRQGHVLSSRIVTSSGSAALDQETLALVQRAQPFPAPPPDLAGVEIRFVVPIRFNIR